MKVLRIKGTNRVFKIDPKQLAMGMKIEQEHKDITHGDKTMTKKIAMAHLKEKSDYYTKLKKAGL